MRRSELQRAQRRGQGGPTRMLYAQPRRTCACGARVLELLSCRDCGSASSRPTLQPEAPTYLWPEEVGASRTLSPRRHCRACAAAAAQPGRRPRGAPRAEHGARAPRDPVMTPEHLARSGSRRAGAAATVTSGPEHSRRCPAVHGSRISSKITSPRATSPSMELVSAQLLEQQSDPTSRLRSVDGRP